MKLVMLDVEISDQMGTSQIVSVGVFDDAHFKEMMSAIEAAEKYYPTQRTRVLIEDIEINTPITLKRVR